PGAGCSGAAGRRDRPAAAGGAAGARRPGGARSAAGAALAARARASGRGNRVVAPAARLENEHLRHHSHRTEGLRRLNPNPLHHLNPLFLFAALRANPGPTASLSLLRGCPYGIWKAHDTRDSMPKTAAWPAAETGRGGAALP